MKKLTDNSNVLKWVDEIISMTNPSNVVWIDGSEELYEELRKEGCSTGELVKLNEEIYPGCYYHRSAKDDVARMEDKTFICYRKKEDAGNTNNWKSPEEAYKL